MKTEFDFFAPLDPQQLQAYASNQITPYGPPQDVWALFITILCYALNEEFNSFYDWTKKSIRKDKVDRSIASLYELGYDNALVKTITDMGNFDASQRLPAQRIMENLRMFA